MIKASTLAALNKQIQHEQGNAHAYESVSLYFGRLGLHGFEAFMTRQAGEERVHAEKFIRHVADRGGRVELATIAAPRVDFESVLDAVKAVRDMERSTTQSIHRLFETARREGDYALEVLLHWYITEQVEEEQWADELTGLVEQFHERAGQLFMLDHQWGKRVKETGNESTVCRIPL
jgi:ferritin